jgi:hypothetical protein
MLDYCMIRYTSSSTIRQRQLWYASIADQTMSLLAEYGSSVEVLDFGCMFNYHIDAGTDENGHTWPNYSYRSGSIAVDGQEDQELRKVVAIPVPITHDGSHL